METKQKLQEVRDILSAIIAGPRDDWPVVLIRAHRLVESALGDFFSEEDDVATLGQWFEDEPFPAA